LKQNQVTVLLAVAVFILFPAVHAHALDLLVSTSSSILRYDASSGSFIDVFNKNDGGLLQRPQGLTIRGGDVYASSELNNRILTFDGSTGNFIGTFVGPPNDGGLQQPYGNTFGTDLYDGAGNPTPDGVPELYVTQATVGDVLFYSGASGEPLGQFTQGPQPGGPRDLEFGRDYNGDGVRDLYVSSEPNNSVKVYDGTTGAWLADFATDKVVRPFGIEWAPNDAWLLVTMQGTSGPRINSVQKFDRATGEWLGDFVTSGSAGLSQPGDLIYGPDLDGDGASDLYVASRGTNEILVYSGLTGDPIPKEYLPGQVRDGLFVVTSDNGLDPGLNPTFFANFPFYYAYLPEPGTFVLLALGALGAIAAARRKRKTD
jgi:hypothetical protein